MADIQYNKTTVTIIGAGGLAREVDSWITEDSTTSFEVCGFWDDNLNALDHYGCEKKVLGNLNDERISGLILIGIMDCKFKQEVYKKLELIPGVTISSYIHESVMIGLRSQIGVGVVLFPKVIVSCDVQIGKGSFVNLGTQIGHDVIVGDYVSIMPHVDLGGGVVIGDNVFIGTGATILPGIKIASNSRIGAGSVVIKSIKKEGTYFGNPAKKIF
ncbi:acetyltransferase [Sphingobacterium sp. SRCM116780]|uniref:acetyltransferase n=1 Tax=Sphingobacterium sp. SRCM116780 TaxID=2907623 RepID=UPI001F301A93|nr:acetyltransferase [Sphingobacterium sp. SRCM116780]UIR55966.1 acetyltransferase [Sphingobacterium sp. SRCM116780]